MYQVQTMSLPGRECVKFALAAFDVGGEPVYCYAKNTVRLVWKNDDVE